MQPQLIGYGYSYRWTDFDGTITQISASGYEDSELCRLDGLAAAKRLGWTERRWWQFWRSADYPKKIPA